jgi:4-oxalocrotonate tautomerase
MYMKGTAMPLAKVSVPAGTLTSEQRRDIVKGIHDVINAVQKKPPERPTYVLIDEVPAGAWGFAGTIYTPRR